MHTTVPRIAPIPPSDFTPEQSKLARVGTGRENLKLVRTLVNHPGVRECVVFGAPSREAERTETIVAFVVGEARERELKHFLLEKLPAWQVPRHWQFVEALPASGRGKVSRAECRRCWLAEN